MRLDSTKTVILLRGVPGCGKSTLARAVADMYGALIVSADDHFMVNGRYTFDGKQLGAAHAACTAAFAQWLVAAEQKVCVVDNTNIKLQDMKRYYDQAVAAGVRVMIWSIDAPSGPTRNTHGVPEATVQAMVNKQAMSEGLVSQLPGYRRVTQAEVNTMLDEE